MRCKDLDRHVAVQGGVERLQHDAHAARADDSHDFVRPPAADHPIVVRRRQQLQYRGLAGRMHLRLSPSRLRNRPSADRPAAVARRGGNRGLRTKRLRWRRSLPVAGGNRRSHSSATRMPSAPRRSISARRNNSIRSGSQVVRWLFIVLPPTSLYYAGSANPDTCTGLRFLLVLGHLLLDSPHDPAPRGVNRPGVFREFFRHDLDGAPFDSGQPESVPGVLAELLANMPGGPAKHLPPVLQPQEVRIGPGCATSR